MLRKASLAASYVSFPGFCSQLSESRPFELVFRRFEQTFCLAFENLLRIISLPSAKGFGY